MIPDRSMTVHVRRPERRHRERPGRLWVWVILWALTVTGHALCRRAYLAQPYEPPEFVWNYCTLWGYCERTTWSSWKLCVQAHDSICVLADPLRVIYVVKWKERTSCIGGQCDPNHWQRYGDPEPDAYYDRITINDPDCH